MTTARLNAGEALLASGIDVAAVRRALPSVEPYAVDIRRAPGWFERAWAKGITAMTLPWGIYMARSAFERLRMGAEPRPLGVLVVHELVHIEQYRRLGPMVHLRRYAADYLRGRLDGRSHWEAYRRVTLEVEARETAASLSAAQGPR